MKPQGSIWNPFYECIEPFRGSKYVALIEPFKVLFRTFSSKSVVSLIVSRMSIGGESE